MVFVEVEEKKMVRVWGEGLPRVRDNGEGERVCSCAIFRESLGVLNDISVSACLKSSL